MSTTTPEQDFGQKLKTETTGCRLELTAISCRRAIGKTDLDRVAEMFEADRKSVSGSRSIIDKKHEYVAPIVGLQAMAKHLVNSHTIDYPEKGLRLVKVNTVPWLHDQVSKIREQMEQAIDQLAGHWEEVKADAQERLGSLYNPEDYPSTPLMSWGIAISFPAIEPDRRLLQLHPELYEAERQRIAAKFDAAVADAENAMAEEFTGMLTHLVDRLGNDDDGKPKTIRKSSLEKIQEFSARFKELSIGSNEQLEALVGQVEDIVSGVEPNRLRKTVGAREQLREALSSKLGDLDNIVIAKPSRVIEFAADE